MHGISGLPDQAKRNLFAGQIELNLLFDLLLVIEVAIRHINPVKKDKTYFSEQAKFLLQRAGPRHSNPTVFSELHFF
jgi:hypothetical protein